MNIPISERSHYLLGRNADVCDIVLDHQSISRKHAVLQFKEGNELFVLDFGSAQGTKVNKKIIPSNEYHKLSVGDVIAFGASSRLYIVNGPAELIPAEYDSKNTRLVRKQMTERSAEIAKKKEQEASAGVSWGFGEDAENSSGDENEEDEKEDKTNLPDYIKNDPNYDRKFGKKYTSDVKDGGEINEKDKELVEKIRTRERKIQNMQEENKKIYMKENSQDGGLTEGQEIAVSRNDNRIQVLIEEIETLQHELGFKTQQRNAIAIKSSKGKSRTHDDYGDDLLDTTGETVDISTNWRLRKKRNAMNSSANKTDHLSGETWTFESLSESKRIESRVLYDIQNKISEINSKIIHDSNNGVTVGAIDDIIKQTESIEAKVDLKKMLIVEAEQNKKLASIEKLLKVATPAINSLINYKSEINESQGSLVPIHNLVADRYESSKSKFFEASETQSVDDKIKTSGAHSKNTILLVPPNNFEGEIELDEQHPQKTTNDVIHLTSETQNRYSDVSEVCNLEEKSINKKRRIIGPSIGDVMASSSSTGSYTTKKVATSIARDKIIISEDSLRFAKGVLEGGDVAWVPPAGQTGSGFTSLNDKFGY